MQGSLIARDQFPCKQRSVLVTKGRTIKWLWAAQGGSLSPVSTLEYLIKRITRVYFKVDRRSSNENFVVHTVDFLEYLSPCKCKLIANIRHRLGRNRDRNFLRRGLQYELTYLRARQVSNNFSFLAKIFLKYFI